MEKRSLIFLGSKPIGYHCFEYLVRNREALNLDLAGLLTNENSRFSGAQSLTQLARDHGIPVFSSPAEMPQVDFLYSVQYHLILTAEQISKATRLAVNLHMAPLPEYRGCNQFTFAILDRKAEFGTTIHVMDSRIDHGDILFEKRFPIPHNCWIAQLYELTFEASKELFENSINAILAENIHPIPQAQWINLRGSHLHLRNEIEQVKHINLDWPREQIERHIRATSMPGFEPPYTVIDGQKIYFSSSWS